MNHEEIRQEYQIESDIIIAKNDETISKGDALISNIKPPEGILIKWF